MGMDEEGTLAQLKGHRQALVDPKLVEFASMVDAVRCAVEVQRGMSARNASHSRHMDRAPLTSGLPR